MLCNDFDKTLDELREEYHRMEERVRDAHETLREFRKDAEIAEANADRDYIRSHALHIFSDKEREADRAFRRLHYEMHTPHTRTSGNTYIYTLTGTGVGTCVKVKCPVCGEEEDITDIGSW